MAQKKLKEAWGVKHIEEKGNGSLQAAQGMFSGFVSALG